jgi:hypothetical protein
MVALGHGPVVLWLNPVASMVVLGHGPVVSSTVVS